MMVAPAAACQAVCAAGVPSTALAAAGRKNTAEALLLNSNSWLFLVISVSDFLKNLNYVS